MLKNCSYQSGQMMVIHEDGIIKVIIDQNTLIYMSPDRFVDFVALCGKMVNDIVRESPTKMGWQPDRKDGEQYVPCPACTFRGPVWLDEKRQCRYCRQTWAQSDSEIWAMIPLKWWLDEEMISEDKIPAVVLVTMRA